MHTNHFSQFEQTMKWTSVWLRSLTNYLLLNKSVIANFTSGNTEMSGGPSVCNHIFSHSTKGTSSNTPDHVSSRNYLYVTPLSRGGRKCGHMRLSPIIPARTFTDYSCWNLLSIMAWRLLIIMDVSDNIP